LSPTTSCGFHGPSEGIQATREHEHTLGAIERPVFEFSELKVLLIWAIMLQGLERKGVPVVRKETQDFSNQRFVLRCVPKAEVSHRNHKGKISTPRLRAAFISPPDSSVGRAVCAKHIRSYLKKVNETRRKMFIEDLRDIFEQNVYISLTPDRV
jgi:hypothetical protein